MTSSQLVEREREVADPGARRAGGWIAQTLFVTPKTVEVHLSNAYRKLPRRDEVRAARRDELWHLGSGSGVPGGA
jgi:DNA-binding NarL/FixJ family response regulator